MDKEERRILENELKYTTLCSAMLEMIDGYYAAYSKNKMDYIDYCVKEALKTRDKTKDLKKFNLFIKNKRTKIRNQENSFLKLKNLLKKDLTACFGNSGLDETLIDAMDKFWNENIIINKNVIKLK